MLALSARRATGGGAFSAHGGECRFVAPSEAAALPGKLSAIAVRLAGPSGRVHVKMPFKTLTVEDIVRMSTLKQQRSSRRRQTRCAPQGTPGGTSSAEKCPYTPINAPPPVRLAKLGMCRPLSEVRHVPPASPVDTAQRLRAPPTPCTLAPRGEM